MSSKTAKPPLRSAAWRISCWATVAFAFGTLAVFVFLHQFVANDIQRRSDVWLSGEVEVLGDVAERTPKDALYDRVVGEIAELATKEVPNRLPPENNSSDTVFFLQSGQDSSLQLWVGAGDGQTALNAIRNARVPEGHPIDIRIPGFKIPYSVATTRIDDGSSIYLGLSDRDEMRVLRNLRARFILLWFLLVLLGFAIVFYTTHRMLSHIREITEAASRIGHSDLHARVPTTQRHDEVSQLAFTLNGMLDRIENAMHQLHTITGSLAHDLRSPLTAIRGKLEMSLPENDEEHSEPIVAAIEELDRLTDFLNKSLDVAEARADALRLNRRELDLSDTLRTMIDLYEPSMSEKNLRATLVCNEPVRLLADEALLHRMIANLLDNELAHLPPGKTVSLELRREGPDSVVLTVSDNGPGFDPNVLEHAFERRVKGRDSAGHGLGLAFVDAVTRAHGGTASVANPPEGGARIVVVLPVAGQELRTGDESPEHAVATIN